MNGRGPYRLGQLVFGLVSMAQTLVFGCWWLAATALLVACTQTPAAAPPVLLAATATAVPTQTVRPLTLSPELTPPFTPAPPPTATAVPTATPPLPQLDNPRNLDMFKAAQAARGEYLLLSTANTGIWRYAPGSFLHPIALEVAANTAYLLDGGRVLALNLAAPTSPTLLLAPGDRVEGVPVIEPLDLTATADGLFVLERAGDVYHYDPAQQTWSLARYNRPIGDTSSHYYVALADRVLVEPSYNFALHFGGGRDDRFWLLPEGSTPVDVSVVNDRTYVMVQNALTVTIPVYADTALVSTFQPDVKIAQARQIVATDTAVYILDRDGRRLLVLDPKTGALQRVVQPPPVSAFWSDGQRLILAGREQLYFVNEPARWQTIPGGPVFAGTPPHDPAVWAALGPFKVPVQGSQLGGRELQMPGAPRHYRLGVHEGVDFYWGAGTPVWAAAAGVVIRATHAYELPDEQSFNQRREALKARGYSTEEDLDFYRGMQVWIAHPDGTVARYAHLSAIQEEIMVGTAVDAGQLIGHIGNTGSPAAVKGPTEDAHLHFELWWGDHYLGQYLRPVEVRELVSALFSQP